MATKFTQICSKEAPLDLVFCAGDDSTDELMFAALNERYNKAAEAPKLYTVSVGKKPSEADSYLSARLP